MPLHGQQLQTKTNIKFAAVMGAATGETCDCAPDLPYAREIAAAIRATVDETRRIMLRRKRQRMTALFVRDSQIPTSLLPLRAVRRNLPPTLLSELREDLSKLVPRRASNYGGSLHHTR